MHFHSLLNPIAFLILLPLLSDHGEQKIIYDPYTEKPSGHTLYQ